VPAPGRGTRGLAAWLLSAALAAAAAGCGERSAGGETVITFPGSAVGAEAAILERQLARFMAGRPGIRIERRSTPDAADQRHQLYVQWLNARVGDPDILQLDVIWTPEFAAAGWILPLDDFAPAESAFFDNVLAANRWQGRLYALPWFVDTGMLYWRTDLLDAPPETFGDLVAGASAAMARAGLAYGYLWQGARYEGLVTVFLEHLGGFGGRIMDESGRVVVDSEAGVRALTFLHDVIHGRGITPEEVLAWQEEQTRFAFQNGEAVLMRNWPYAYALLADPAPSRVAGRFAVAPMPAAPGGAPTAALGGAQLAINAHSEHPAAAYAVIDYLTRPEQMLERAEAAGQLPARRALYEAGPLAARLERALPIPVGAARAVIERATPRPVTPVYTELSQLLQVWLHRALTRQVPPRRALGEARRAMSALLERVGLAPGAGGE